MSNAIWTAFEANDVEAFEASLKKCPNPNALLVNCDNPIPCQAARSGRRAILAAALRVDAWGVTAADRELRTPLHYAALAGDLEAVRILFELKPERVRADMLIKQQDVGKMTVLHSAVLSGNEELVLLLLEVGQGAAVDMRCRSGYFPVHFACSKGMSDAVEIMCQHEHAADAIAHLGSAGDSLLHRATVEGHIKVIRVLLRFGVCNPNLQDLHGCTALHLAYAMGLADIIELLLPVTDQDLLDGQGKRALDWSLASDDEQSGPTEAAADTENTPQPPLVDVNIRVDEFGLTKLSIRPSNILHVMLPTADKESALSLNPANAEYA